MQSIYTISHRYDILKIVRGKRMAYSPVFCERIGQHLENSRHVAPDVIRHIASLAEEDLYLLAAFLGSRLVFDAKNETEIGQIIAELEKLAAVPMHPLFASFKNALQKIVAEFAPAGVESSVDWEAIDELGWDEV